MLNIYTDEYFMKQALMEAERAFHADEIPVGAIIVSNNKIIAKAHNQTELLNDVTAHAEIIAITSAASHLGAKYLQECTMFITLEPCVMCAGALYWSQIGRVVYGADDDKKGFMRFGKEMLHPSTKLEFGIMYEECSHLLKEFFKMKRSRAADH
jgi:tRNA(adenine34) deaminase